MSLKYDWFVLGIPANQTVKRQLRRLRPAGRLAGAAANEGREWTVRIFSWGEPACQAPPICVPCFCESAICPGTGYTNPRQFLVHSYEYEARVLPVRTVWACNESGGAQYSDWSLLVFLNTRIRTPYVLYSYCTRIVRSTRTRTRTRLILTRIFFP